MDPEARLPAARTVWRPAFPVDVRRTLAPLSRGRRDPTYQVTLDGSVWRTTLMATGPASYRLAQRGLHDITCDAWGPGAVELVNGLPDLLGGSARDAEFALDHPLLERTRRIHPGLRVPRTGRVFEALVPAVLEQKVTVREARASFRRLLQAYGTAAPGPVPDGMRVPPPPEVWRRIPSWDWHRAGVDPRRARTILAAAQVAPRLEETVALPTAAASAKLQLVPGIGVWTAAEIAQRALGDGDALSVGDYHLSAFVGWALLGRPLDDDAMVELMQRWQPHRYRVVRLLEVSGAGKPRFGPRSTITDHRSV